jgi:hypothetical protein
LLKVFRSGLARAFLHGIIKALRIMVITVLQLFLPEFLLSIQPLLLSERLHYRFPHKLPGLDIISPAIPRAGGHELPLFCYHRQKKETLNVMGVDTPRQDEPYY